MRVIRTGYGARLVHGRSYLSKVLRRPGPTDEVFDVLAAAMRLAPGGPAAMLGFAGGSLLAPLRAMGDRRAVRAVDLDPAGVTVFGELCSSWAGDVRIDTGEAAAWLRASRRRWPLIVDDLSADGPDGATKPRASIERIPDLVRQRLAKGGWFVCNVLPIEGLSAAELIRRVTRGHRDVVVVSMHDHDNRVVLAASDLPGTRRLAGAMRAALRGIRSSQADRIGARRRPAVRSTPDRRARA